MVRRLQLCMCNLYYLQVKTEQIAFAKALNKMNGKPYSSGRAALSAIHSLLAFDILTARC